MTTMPPSPFLSESSDTVETLSSVSTGMEAASHPVPPAAGEAADHAGPAPCDNADAPLTESELANIGEIFHFGRRLVEEARERERAGRAGLAAVAREIERWQEEADPLPLFLRQA